MHLWKKEYKEKGIQKNKISISLLQLWCRGPSTLCQLRNSCIQEWVEIIFEVVFLTLHSTYLFIMAISVVKVSM